MSASAWRPVFAALANEATRRVYAEIVLGSDAAGAGLSPSRRRHALESLTPQRTELLRHVAARALDPGEVLNEAELNERLARFSEDTAALRRYLVDAEMLERTASGSQYARVRTP